jgi:hypothetical protein
MHYTQGKGYIVMRDAQVTDPGYVLGTDVTKQVLGRLPDQPRLLSPSIYPVPTTASQDLMAAEPGRCKVLLTSALTPADLTQPIGNNYVDVS